MPPALQQPKVVENFFSGYDNAMSRYAREQALEGQAIDRQWEEEKRQYQRGKMAQEEDVNAIWNQIDFSLPYVANKDKVRKLPPDKQQAVLSFYAKTPADQRKRLARVQQASREFIVNTFPKIRDEQTYQQVRAMAPQFLAQNGATQEEIQKIMQTSFPPKYDPRTVETLMAMAGYKPDSRVMSPGSSLVRDGEIVLTAPQRPVKKDKEPTVDKALAEIAKAKEKIARLVATKGLDAMTLLTMDRESAEEIMRNKNLAPETREAIMAQRDIAEYYERFVNRGKQPPGDPQAVYNRLRDSGKTHEQAVQEMQKMGY